MLNKQIRKKNINYQREADLYTPLMYAVVKGNREFTERLLHANANKEYRDGRENTALLLALSHNELALASLLLEQGADATVHNELLYTPLSYLAMQDNEGDPAKLALQKSLIGKLVDAGCKLEKRVHSPLLMAAEYGNYEMMTALLDAGASITWTGSENKTLYTQALRGGDVRILRYVLEHYPDAGINKVFDYEFTPIMLAVERQNTEVAKYLIDNGADLDYMTSTSFTPLKAAVINSHHEIISTILERKSKLLDMNDSVDNDLMASSVVFADDPRVFWKLAEREKYYYAGTRAEKLSNEALQKGDLANATEYMEEALGNFEQCYETFNTLAKDYEDEAKTLKLLNSNIFGSSVYFRIVWLTVGGFKKDPELLEKISIQYASHASQMSFRVDSLEEKAADLRKQLKKQRRR